jgi:peptide deformylase
MAELKIRIHPDPVLRKKTQKVTVIDKSTKKLVADMLETVHAVPGRAGLAAPQVGKSLRVCVINVPDEEDENKSVDYILINPEIIKKKGERIIQEGCLSLPGYVGEVKRAEKVTAKCKNLEGKEVRIRGEGLLAQALEHEVNHLDGILYIDLLESPEKLHKIQQEEIDEGEPENGDGIRKEN